MLQRTQPYPLNVQYIIHFLSYRIPGIGADAKGRTVAVLNAVWD